MGLIRINSDPSRRQLALFGAAWLLFFVAVGLLVYRSNASATVAAAWWVLAAAVPAIGWFYPGFLRTVYLSIAHAMFPIGLVVSYVVLLAVYYLLLTPIGLAMKLVGYDPLNRRLDPAARSYWVTRKPPATIDRYFNQF